jgi:hypothetical protein
MSVPDGWTDDMTIVLGTGTIAELVDFIITEGLARTPAEMTCVAIQARFRISPDDAALAMDRTYGGIVRAGTAAPANCPDPQTDPIAFESHQRVRRDATIIKQLRPPS